RPWPECDLLPRVLEHGLFLSEREPEEPPRPQHFPLRNRLISALSQAVLVVEAAHASGSLITARWAADQGRSVWALPGRVDHPMSRGTHRLIREGAALIEDPDEIVSELLGATPSSIPGRSGEEGSSTTGPRGAILIALEGETL